MTFTAEPSGTACIPVGVYFRRRPATPGAARQPIFDTQQPLLDPADGFAVWLVRAVGSFIPPPLHG
jgi:hypothetical protein